MKITTAIRQGYSLIPLLFNILMNEIIDNLPKNVDYKMDDTILQIVWYAEDVVLIADKKVGLQRLLYGFNMLAQQYNTVLSTKNKQSI